jgi:hypothetical protein
MPQDSFFWAHKMAPVYILPLPTTLPKLAGRIKAAAAAGTPTMLTNMFNEFKIQILPKVNTWRLLNIGHINVII